MSNGRIQIPGQQQVAIQALEAPNEFPATVMMPGPVVGIIGGVSQLQAGAMQIAAAIRSSSVSQTSGPEAIAAEAKQIAQAVIDECKPK